MVKRKADKSKRKYGKKLVYVKWGKGQRRRKVDIKDYRKKGKYKRFDLWVKKTKKKSRKAYGRKGFKKEKKVNYKKGSRREIGRRYLKGKIEKGKNIGIGVGIQKKKKEVKQIKDVFEKKVSKVVIKNFLDIPINELNLQYKPLLKAVMDIKSLGDLATDDVLDAMIKQENINKIKWRFEIRANVYGIDGKTVLSMVKGSGGDLMDLRERMKKGIWRGASVDYDIDVGDGYIFKLINKGNIDRVEVTVVFRS